MFEICLLICIVALILFALGARVIPSSEVYVVEKLGRSTLVLKHGFHYIIPVIERCVKRIDTREQVRCLNEQKVTTRDNILIGISAVVNYTVSDYRKFANSVSDPVAALSSLMSTKLRVVISKLKSDEVLLARDTMNNCLIKLIEDVSTGWGITINYIEVKDITLPETVMAAIERKVCAEYDRKRILLEADSYKLESITKAKADKQAALLRAEGKCTSKTNKK